jgi:hypothetical protein
MPTTNGQLQLQDYDAALVARGFDGYQPAERAQLINMGYRYVARKNTSVWEQASKTYTMAPGDPPLSVAGASLLGADNINQVFVMTDPYRRKLEVMNQTAFERQWLPLDLTVAANRAAAPDWYYVFNNLIYILPPPQTTMAILVYFQNYLPDMVVLTDVPAIPQIFDEVILDAALMRAHRRASEIQLATEAQGRVDEAMMDIAADDVWTMSEQQERVVPDNQWL